MEYFLAVAGLVWIFCGALVLGLSAGTTPELVACLAFSFGVMFLGLSALLGHLRKLNVTSARSAAAQFSDFPPPVPLEYAIPIEDAINSARVAVRLADRPAWARPFDADRSAVVNSNTGGVAHQPFSYPAPAQYFREMLPAAYQPPTELVETDVGYYVEQPSYVEQSYYVEQPRYAEPPRTPYEANALERLRQIFPD